jgi:hypothetical protein
MMIKSKVDIMKIMIGNTFGIEWDLNSFTWTGDETAPDDLGHL